MSALSPSPPSAADAQRLARRALRAETRKLLAAPHEVSAHLSRLTAALGLPGNEPVQAALADLLAATDSSAWAARQTAYALAAPRLAPHVAHAMEHALRAGPLLSPTPLATRWCVLARPSVDIPVRARRTSADDSRAIAQEALDALQHSDLDGIAQFLDHCRTCRDTLAFMLVRREVAKRGLPLPTGWEEVSRLLESPMEAAA